MKNTIRQVFHSSKFVTGFVIFMIILLTMFIYPLINPGAGHYGLPRSIV